MRREELLECLTLAQLEKAKKYETSQELLDLAKEEGIELTEDQLDAVSGGACLPIVHEDRFVACSNCGFVTRGHYVNSSAKGRIYEFQCDECRLMWTEDA